MPCLVKAMHKKPFEIKVIYGILLAFFALFLLFPTAMLLREALQTENGMGLAHFSKVLSGSGFLKAFTNSFRVSAVSARTEERRVGKEC